MTSPTVLYIAGASRSGSTILGQTLGEVPGFTFLGELYHLWGRGLHHNQLCGCGQRLRECVFWQEVLSGDSVLRSVLESPDQNRPASLTAKLVRLRRLPSLLGDGRLVDSSTSSLIREYQTVLGKLYERLHAVLPSNSIIVDSSKHATYGAVLLGMSSLRVSVLHLVRDARAVAHSMSQPKQRPEIDDQRACMRARPAPAAALHWVANNLAVSCLTKFASESLRVKYEDFVDSPVETIHRVTRFFNGCPAIPSSLQDGNLACGLNHSVSGNPVRFDRGRIRLRVDDRWRGQMPVLPKCLVTLACSPLLGRYGYPGVL